MAAFEDSRTTQRPSSPPARPTRRPGPCLTLLAHPDPARIGEIAPITRDAQVSRVEPAFAMPGERGVRRAEPLGDVHLSRRPALRIAVGEDGGELVRLDDGAEVVVDGAPMQARVSVTTAQLHEGVTIELEGRVALLLHLRGAPRAGAGHELVGDSEVIERLRMEIDAAAGSAAPVLVRGETGTGKELVASALHRASPRAGGAFVAVNLAAIPASTAAAALFGHRRGAFTGAVDAGTGYFRRAEGGTLFLDEVGAAPLDLQALLLRALEQHEIQPVGASDTERVDVRVIAATDADLEEECARGRFRAALFHRLSALAIDVPPLRARRDDIARLLVALYRDELRELGRGCEVSPAMPWLPPAHLAALCRAPWPGNVRALRNLCRRLATRSGDDEGVRVKLVDELLAAPVDERTAVDRVEPSTTNTSDAEILEALGARDWQIGRTAKDLGIARNTVYAAMERSGRIAKARDLDTEAVRTAVAEARGDLEATARALRVSLRALKLRMRELGLT